MEIETLQAELERLFDLNALLDMTSDVLGFSADSVGGTTALGSYAQALIRHCIQADALEALCDAVLLIKPNAGPTVAKLRDCGLSAEPPLVPGTTLGDIRIVRHLGSGRAGTSYLGHYGNSQVRVKILSPEVTHDRRRLQRFAAVTRLAARVEHPALPSNALLAAVDDRVLVVHDYVEAPSLAQQVARNGAVHIMEALPLINAILEPLAALHAQGIAHGDLRLENVLVHRAPHGQPTIALLDVGTDRLRARRRSPDELDGTVVSPKSIAPELLNGDCSSVTTDVYAVGALLYELLTAHPPFEAVGFGAAAAHYLQAAQPPSAFAPPGWINRELDEFILSLLAKQPSARPHDARAILERLGNLGRLPSFRPSPALSESELARRLEALALEPESQAAAVALDEALNDGADAERVADAFRMAAMALDEQGTPAHRELKKEHFLRSAQIYEHTLRDLEKAENLYLWALNAAPEDHTALRSLERVRRGLGKFEELIEVLLNRGDQTDSLTEKGRCFYEIGRIYQSDLADLEQALVAFTQAYCEDPEKDLYAEEIEKLAGSKQEAWTEVLDSCSSSVQESALAPDPKKRLMVQVGRWYHDKLARPDLALPCYQAVIALDATYEPALDAMAQLYRKGQQWTELGLVLTRWADAVKNPGRARDIRTDAGELAEHQLGDLAAARALYEAVLAEDPTHERATEGLSRACERSGDYAGLIKVQQVRADGLRGEEQIAAVVKIAEIYETRLNNDVEAVKVLERLLSSAPESMEVLRALERVYAKVGRFAELIGNLEHQVQLSTTPRQKTQLFERIAAVYEEEFLDNERAAAALRAVLALDPHHEGALTSLTRICRSTDHWPEVAELLERHLAIVSEPARKIMLALQLGRVLAEQLSAADRAMEAFELVLSFEPQHAEALEMVARIRVSLGDADAALAAIDVLAAKANTPVGKAEHLWRAAKLLEERGDLDQAVEYYKRALDAVPDHPATTLALRQAYLTKGDAHAAVQLLNQEILRTEGERAKAKLFGERALILHEQLHDSKNAEEAANAAISRDPTNVDALTVLGDLAFDAGRFIEASKHLASLIDRVESMNREQARRVLLRAVESLTKAESVDRAHAAANALVRICADDLAAQVAAGAALFKQGDPAKTAEFHQKILQTFETAQQDDERATTLYRYGESLRRAGNAAAAIAPLEEATELSPNEAEPLVALGSAYGALNRWTDVVKTKYRQLDIAIGDDRIQLLIELGDIIAEKFGDRPRAIQSLVAALEDRPDDRRLLTKLMQLYGDEKDWTRLVEVVMRLAGFVDDQKQRAKYLQTAAIVSARQLGDVDRAVALFEQVIDLDPSVSKALTEAIDLHRTRGDFAAVERLLRRKLEQAISADDKSTQITTYTALAELYERDLGWTDYAITALEHLQALEPSNLEVTKKLAEICASDPAHHIEGAAAAHLRLIDKEPARLESYRTMRRLYTETKNADGAWCLCQTLSVLGLADPDEERFYKRMRSETAAPAQAVFSEPDWLAVTHPDTNPLLTSLFAIIEPAVIQARTEELTTLGYDPARAIDLSQTPAPMTQTLFYAAGVMGIVAPTAFELPDDPGGLSFLHARTPAVGLGRVAMSPKVPPQAAAFIAARHLSYLRPGFYLRQLMTHASGLKAWLFAAIKLISPQFPISPDIEGPVKEAMAALDMGVRGAPRDELARVVSTLLREGAALDLKKWVGAVDLSADRAGFVLAHDLDTSVQLLRASDESTSAVPGAERQRQLALFAISSEYLGLRRRLRIAVDL